MKNGIRLKLYDKDGNEINLNDLNIVVPPMTQDEKGKFLKGKRKAVIDFSSLKPIKEKRVYPKYPQSKN